MFMFDEKLIEATKRRAVIYNPSNKSNRYVELKEQAWTQIALELGAPVKKCKARWASLRDRFRRITKAQRFSLQNGNKIHNKWRYYEALSFLLHTSLPNANNGFADYTINPQFEVESMFSIDQFQKVDCMPAGVKVKRLEEPDPIKEESAKNGCTENDATDMFFLALAGRIKAANLSPLTQMKLEADILHFAINELEQIQANKLY